MDSSGTRASSAKRSSAVGCDEYSAPVDRPAAPTLVGRTVAVAVAVEGRMEMTGTDDNADADDEEDEVRGAF